MARKRRVFSDEFKLEAVRRVRERTALGVTLAQISRDLGVRADLLRQWERLEREREGAAGLGEGLSGLSPAELAREVRRLQRENDTLRQERDFAKKAAAYFAKEFR